MTKLRIISLASIALAGVAAALVIQYKSQVKFRERDALMRQQDQQLAALTAEHQRLSNLVAQAQSAPPEDHTAELAKLRRAAEALKKQTNDLGRQWGKSHESRPSQPASSPASHTPEYYEQLHQMAGSKPTEARDLAGAFQNYAMDHQNQSPSNLDQLAPYLAKENRTLSGSNQFEIVYSGSLDNLQGIPWGSVAVVREQQPWPGPDGRMMRVYGMMGGIGQIVGSDDNLQSWEAKHVISSPTVGQSGQ
ncbi:MAG: hypothetical protein ABSH38_06640 [Verrucomicrobiota bacterium]|jgi:hypothetical protein